MNSASIHEPVMYVSSMAVFLNRWYATYEDARAERESKGGYLLPYERQFFVAEGDAVRLLGLDPQDPDWERIGWDWVRPLDTEAWQRLKTKRELAR